MGINKPDGPASATRLRTTERTATLRTVADKSIVTSLDDLDVTRQETKIVQAPGERRTKMQIAKEFEQKATVELAEVMKGIEDELAGIGMKITTVERYQGIERFWKLIRNKERADSLRLQRMRSMNIQESIDRIEQHVHDVIDGLGKIEANHVSDVKKYDESLKRTLKRYKEAQPIYKDWREKRKDIEVDLAALETDLKAGTVSEEERPAKETELDELKKKLHEAEIQEKAHLTIVTDAQREIPNVQNSRDGAQKEIEAIHTMRLSFLEKLNNTRVMLETAMTNIITKAELERVRIVDPAFNKTLTLIAENNEKTAGAVLEIVAERLGKAAIDPAKSAELISNLMGHMKEFAERMDAIATEAEKGTRAPLGDGGNESAGNGRDESTSDDGDASSVDASS